MWVLLFLLFGLPLLVALAGLAVWLFLIFTGTSLSFLVCLLLLSPLLGLFTLWVEDRR